MSELTNPEGSAPKSDSRIVLDSSNPLYAALEPEQQRLFQQYDLQKHTMQEEIQALAEAGSLPIAHGTSSNYLESILEKGLGAVMPVGALHGTKSATDASTTDGILGAYLFAKGLKGDTLAIQREQVDPNGDSLVRYTKVSPRIPPDSLRRQITRYFEARASLVGKAYVDAYPVLLVANTTNPEQLQANNPAVPSEKRFEGIYERDNFVMICVPESKIPETQAMIDKFNLQIKARAIEPLELF